jgi:hypothetical protein
MTKFVAPALAALVVSWPLAAGAQVPTVTPDGKLADPAAPAPSSAPPPPPPQTIYVPAPGAGPAQPGAAGPAGAPAADTGTGTGFYHTDDYGNLTDDGGGMGDDGPVQVHGGGAVPPIHTVRSGDTLWDISWFYFNNPWEWPRVWSYNPEITNPHWIYPGDQVRLYEGGQAPATAGNGNGGDGKAGPDQPIRTPSQTGEGFFELRQLAFVGNEDLKSAITVDGSPEEKMLLAAGDEVYLAYPKQRPPRVGQRYAIYQERKRVKHPDSGKDVGAYVKIVGEVEVISVKENKRARAVILDSVDVIERGQRVGPLQRQFKNVDATTAEVDLEGTIVAEIGTEQLIGARQVVVLDRGSENRVKVGNRLHVVRRGDAYQKVMGQKTNIGMNDSRYPARSFGEVMVVQTGKRNAIAVVTRSDKEFGVGDHVLMVRGK